MRPPRDRAPSRSRPGWLARLFGIGRPPAPAPLPPDPPPLFRPRPLPPAAPKGPGLPGWDEILSAAPPVPDPARPARPTLVRPPPPPPAPVPRPPVPRPPVPKPAAPPAALPATPLPDWAPGRLLRGAALALAEDGGVQVLPAAAAAAPPAGARPDELAIVLRHPEGLARAPAVAELLHALFVLHREWLPALRPARLYLGGRPWAEGSAQAQMLAVLFPGLVVVAAPAGPVREDHLLVLDAAARNAATGTLIGGMMPVVAQPTAEARRLAHAAFGLPETAEPPRGPGRPPRVLYLPSPPPRTLAEPVRERLFALLARAGYDVAAADMAALPWARQVRLAYGADLIVGAHGPAMSAILWAHPQTRVLEFFPEGARRYDAQLLAEAAGLAYLGLEGVAEKGFIVRARERFGPPAGKANRLVWALPWSMLEQALALPPAPPPP